MDKKSRGLGRGLGALLPSQPIYQEKNKDEELIRNILIEKIVPNINQPRREFDEVKLQELTDSIKEHGILQPIIVVPKENKFMIVAGERRYRSAQKAGLREIPCIVREISNSKVLELALIENIQREDLVPIEEAKALHMLTEQLSVSKTDLAKRLGKSRSYVSNMIRLLSLPVEVQQLLSQGKISYGHARALLSLENQADMFIVAQEIVRKNLSVREVEKLVKFRILHNNIESAEEETEVSEEEKLRGLILKDIENSLKSVLKTQVQIKDSINKGRIIIDYYSDDDLDRLVNRLKSNK